MKVITQSSIIKIQHQVKFFIKEGHVNLSTMLNLKKAYGCTSLIHPNQSLQHKQGKHELA
jgi:hypothetical protein